MQERTEPYDWQLDDTAKKLLAAASDLRYFSAEELAVRAAVNPASAAEFLHGRTDLIEVLSKPMPSVIGRKIIRTHQLRIDRTDAVAAWLAKQYRLQGDRQMIDEPSLLERLESVLRANSQFGYDPRRLQRSLALTTRQFLGAQANYEDRLAANRPLEANEKARLTVAAQTITRLRSRATAMASWVDSFAERRVALENYVIDWTMPLPNFEPPSLVDLGLILDDAESIADMLEDRARSAEDPWPAVCLIAALREEIPMPVWESLSEVMSARLNGLDPIRAPHPFMALVLTASIFDLCETALPILGALIRIRGAEGTALETLRLGFFALARLARPRQAAGYRPVMKAVQACRILLLSQEDDMDCTLALVPAALPETESRDALVRRLALQHFRMRPVSQPVFAASLRNLAVALACDHFTYITENIGSLLYVPHGRFLIEALGHRQTGVLKFENTIGKSMPFSVGTTADVARLLNDAPENMQQVEFDIPTEDPSKATLGQLIDISCRSKPSPFELRAKERTDWRRAVRQPILANAW